MKKAFTMVELVFVIIVLGILTSMSLNRIERDIKQEAADNILSAIRYTQHLALIDDKQNYKENDWYRSLWVIRFEQNDNKWRYKIGSDMDKEGNIDNEEAAIDPLSGKYLFSTDNVEDKNESSTIFLTNKYGITDISFNDCKGTRDTSAKHIAFDHLGRPHRGVLYTTSSISGSSTPINTLPTYISNKNCEIDFEFGSEDNNLTIIIQRETGYAYIKNQPDS